MAVSTSKSSYAFDLERNLIGKNEISFGKKEKDSSLNGKRKAVLVCSGHCDQRINEKTGEVPQNFDVPI